tara:strand:+ start:117 stop:299 length:183 start_codon:yes stop_codon:yes gene_type:complete
MAKEPSRKTLHTSGTVLGVGKDGYQKGGITFKPPLGQPTKNKVRGQKGMLASKRSEVNWY